MGVLGGPGATVTLHVGDELDLHVTTEAPSETGAPEPIYPLPSLTDSSVLALIAMTDNGSTASYRAAGAGQLTLTTSGLCFHGSDETRGPCPILTVNIVGA